MHIDEEKRDSALLEKYVLGLCNMSEQKEVESLISRNPEIASRVGEMRKAVKNYCSSCYGDKVQSILKGKDTSISCRSTNDKPKLRHLAMKESGGWWHRICVFLRSIFFSPSGRD
ncbi:MAG: hypothetical protein KDC53_00645 [Saprospiraceae bacterium]|nr:hypothetical protein [Saprospiraceae bacterium]